PLATAAMTSPFRTWPRLPEPSTCSADRLFSESILAAAGAAGMSDAADLVAAGSVTLAGAASAGLAAGADGAAPAAPSAIWPRSASRPTVSPFWATISVSTPEAGAGTSTVTLSVSSSTSGSSALTVSPTFLNQVPTVASLTDSPRVGTRI